MTTPKQLNASPLDLKGYDFIEVHVSATESDEPTGTVSLVTSRASAQQSDDSRNFKLTLSVELTASEAKQAPAYEAKLVIRGFFHVAENYPEKKIADLINVTGASILWGACREMLSNLTARGPHGIISLPSVSFAPIEPIKTKKKAARKTAKKKRKPSKK